MNLLRGEKGNIANTIGRRNKETESAVQIVLTSILGGFLESAVEGVVGVFCGA